MNAAPSNNCFVDLYEKDIQQCLMPRPDHHWVTGKNQFRIMTPPVPVVIDGMDSKENRPYRQTVYKLIVFNLDMGHCQVAKFSEGLVKQLVKAMKEERSMSQTFPMPQIFSVSVSNPGTKTAKYENVRIVEVDVEEENTIHAFKHHLDDLSKLVNSMSVEDAQGLLNRVKDKQRSAMLQGRSEPTAPPPLVTPVALRPFVAKRAFAAFAQIEEASKVGAAASEPLQSSKKRSKTVVDEDVEVDVVPGTPSPLPETQSRELDSPPRLFVPHGV